MILRFDDKKASRIAISISVILLFSNFCLTNNGSLKKRIDNPPIKIMSYNIRVGTPVGYVRSDTTFAGPWDDAKRQRMLSMDDFSYTDLKSIAQVINKESPDLVALQEVDSCTIRSGKDSQQAKDLAKMTGMYYHFAKAVNRSGGVQGVAILSRFPILESVSLKMPVPVGARGETRSLALAVVNVGGEKVVFCSMHIDHLASSTRAYQVGLVLKFLEKYKKYPIFWAGDFNMPPEDPVLQNLINKHGYILQSTKELTFNSVNPYVKIDYILRNKAADDSYRVVDFYTVDEKYASDHRPLVMEAESKLD